MRLRAVVTILGLLVGVLWVYGADMGISAVGRAGAGTLARLESLRHGPGEQDLERARRAEERGELRVAERLYRAAWGQSPTRAKAAAALRRLHDDRGLEPRVDEASVDMTMRALGAGFMQVESRRFVLVTDLDDAVAVRRLGALERTYERFFEFADSIGQDAAPPEHKLLCVIFGDEERYRAFARSQDGVQHGWIAGYYAALPNRVVLYDDAFEGATGAPNREAASAVVQGARVALASDTAPRAETGDATEQKLVHEAAHLLAFNCGLQLRSRQYPFWLTEGIATWFEGADGCGPPPPTGDAAVPLETLVGMTGPADDDADRVARFYAQCAALFARLVEDSPGDVSALLDDLRAEPAGASTPQRLAEVFRNRFRADAPDAAR